MTVEANVVDQPRLLLLLNYLTPATTKSLPLDSYSHVLQVKDICAQFGKSPTWNDAENLLVFPVYADKDDITALQGILAWYAMTLGKRERASAYKAGFADGSQKAARDAYGAGWQDALRAVAKKSASKKPVDLTDEFMRKVDER